jgi:hypothetical protein
MEGLKKKKNKNRAEKTSSADSLITNLNKTI